MVLDSRLRGNDRIVAATHHKVTLPVDPADWLLGGNPRFRQQTEDYMRYMDLLGRKIVRLLALSLQLPEDFLLFLLLVLPRSVRMQ